MVSQKLNFGLSRSFYCRNFDRQPVYVRLRKACSQFLDRPPQHTAIGPLEHVTSNVKECTAVSAFKRLLSGCLPKILITQIGHKIDFLEILYVNCTLSGYFKNTFRLGSKCFLQQFTRGVPSWTKMHILLVQKCQFSIPLVTPHNT